MTPQTLRHVFGIRERLAVLWAPFIARALDLSECSTVRRKAAWLAQIGHESGNLRYTREIWGPTPQQLRYEPGTLLAKRLGNTEPGDGMRFMGRGLLQTTGRANYRQCTTSMSSLVKGINVPDFEEEPERLQQPEWAALSAALFWKTRNLNRFADSGDFVELTRRINGGYNGLAHRQHLYVAAMGVLK